MRFYWWSVYIHTTLEHGNWLISFEVLNSSDYYLNAFILIKPIWIYKWQLLKVYEHCSLEVVQYQENNNPNILNHILNLPEHRNRKWRNFDMD